MLVGPLVVRDASTHPHGGRVVFVGGTKEWKLRTLTMWTESFERVHVGAINSFKVLMRCQELGVESTDGTGWFRGPRMTEALERYFKVQSGEIELPKQVEMAI